MGWYSKRTFSSLKITYLRLLPSYSAFACLFSCHFFPSAIYLSEEVCWAAALEPAG